jgi:hypothetical protein
MRGLDDFAQPVGCRIWPAFLFLAPIAGPQQGVLPSFRCENIVIFDSIR